MAVPPQFVRLARHLASQDFSAGPDDEQPLIEQIAKGAPISQCEGHATGNNGNPSRSRQNVVNTAGAATR
jgi:hypothetical protein